MAKKIIVIVFSILIFNTCSMLDKQYSFSAIEYIKGISIVGSPKNIYIVKILPYRQYGYQIQEIGMEKKEN